MLNQAYVLLGSQTFAHCHQLRRVIHAEGLHGCEDAFLDTPYEAEQKGEPWVPPEQRHSWIGASPEGRRFLDSLRDEIETMRALPNPEGRDDFAYDDRTWFDDAFNILHEGWLAGEPTLMYLFARYIEGMCKIDGSAYLGEEVYGMLCPGLEFWAAVDEVMKNEDAIVRALYLKAADAGSPHAALWAAYRLEGGDPERSARYGEAARGRLNTLELEELGFLKGAFLDLVEATCDAERQADIIGDAHGFHAGEYEHLLPDPGWRALHMRCIELACFMLKMGLPYVPCQQGHDYQWPSDYGKRAADLAGTMEAWAKWCAERGYVGGWERP